jgi:hypothetical protein
MIFDDENIDEPDYWDDDDQDENGDSWKTKQLKEESANLKKLADQILKTTEAITETLPEEPGTDDERMLFEYRGLMMENALTLRIKISGAMASRDYILMNEKAVVIKLAARDLMTQTSGLRMMDYEHDEYLEMLRNEIDEFRKVFVRWVRSFPKEEPLFPDGWGLFYTDEDVQKWNSINPEDKREE